ncbi:hypothetical protein [Roseobacter sinensis]|uniref:Uncharacterized protein n=1 Tax=Roseobacter sinensis TaxID=2931391 RepID=A0ABT3BC32_9RHOB|nr:hypothetical protein [Roseobacter sp. WL0113]MCV3271140.1 hypothetical protein [Roseobacter sp. WL0113]
MFELVVLTRASALLAICMALTPGVFSLGPYLESRYFPVVRDTRIMNEETVPGGVSFFVQFRKVRQCKFEGLAWYVGDVRVPVDFEPTAETMPRSRPMGGQYAGPWYVPGLPGTRGTHAYAYHRCHPLWETITRFYEG